MRALHSAKTSALMITTGAFDVIGVRALFKFNPLERNWRDVRTVTLHTRESQLMRLLAEGEIGFECLARRWLQGNQPLLAELAVADDQTILDQIAAL